MAAPMEEVPYDSDEEKTLKRMLNEAKRLRAEGREYVNKQGQVKNERRTGDKCRCRRNCLSTFSPEATKMILENFNRIGSQDGQDAYLYGLITASQTVRRRPKGEVASHQQNHQFHYKVKLGEEEKIVCREGFASLHGVGTKRVRRVADHVAQGAAPKDKRGKHNNHRTIPDELREKPLYQGLLPVKAAKLRDVQNLARCLSQEAQEFINNVESTVDRGGDDSDYEDE
ncbi:hypothetical protein GJAV_G00102330 [Gymnothorax javanicus]|nr:hypothetical protein GJAV_G00102330 [Gymnothorax javanicus]